MTDDPATAPPSIGDADWLSAPATQKVFAALTARGHTARAVGGCVRNTLLALLDRQSGNSGSVAGITDIDIATTSTPNETVELAEAAGLRTAPTGLQHGTVTVISDHKGFEVTTLRCDIATDGRHAEVAFTDDWALDAARRDLTMNALYADPDGTIFDPLGGYADLSRRKVRFVGDAGTRIREDYLRVLRFFRFFAQYGHGQPDPDGLKACIAGRRGLDRLSSERIQQELLKLLVSPGATETLDIMIAHGILTEVLPAAPNLTRFTRLVALDGKAPDAALRLAALTVHTATDAGRLADRLRLSNQDTHTLALAASILDNRAFSRPDDRTARRLLYALGNDDYHRRIRFGWGLSSAPVMDADWSRLLELPASWPVPRFPVRGQDLIDMGAKPGPGLGDQIKRLEQFWLDQDFRPTRTQLLEISTKDGECTATRK